MVTHRVVENDRQKRTLRTKGDNNNIEDSAPVRYSDVIGRVSFGIPEAGKAVLFLSNPSGQIKAGIIVGAVIVIILLCKLFFGGNDDDEEEDDEDNGNEKDSDGGEKAPGADGDPRS